MKKLFASLVLVFALFTSTNTFAQFEQGDNLFNAGINLGGPWGGGFGLGASYEAGIHDFISVGAQVDWVNWTSYWKYNFLTLAGRGSYHFGKHFLTIDNLDLYAGVALGYRISNDPFDNTWIGTVYSSGVHFGGFAGARYYFQENFGVFAEVGYNASPLKAGITLKF